MTRYLISFDAHAMDHIPAEDLPAVPRIQVTTEGTLIMRPVPDQGPAPAGEVMLSADGTPDDPGASRKRANRR